MKKQPLDSAPSNLPMLVSAAFEASFARQQEIHQRHERIRSSLGKPAAFGMQGLAVAVSHGRWCTVAYLCLPRFVQIQSTGEMNDLNTSIIQFLHLTTNQSINPRVQPRHVQPRDVQPDDRTPTGGSPLRLAGRLWKIPMIERHPWLNTWSWVSHMVSPGAEV